MTNQSSPELLNRYLQGQHQEVWEELARLGPGVRQEPVITEALAVTREIMTRARRNLEILASRLVRIGYKFDYPDLALVPPQVDVETRIAALEKLAGTLPLSLGHWYEVLGSVCFMGSHPEWPSYFAGDFLHDPIVVHPIEFAFDEFENWKSIRKSLGEVSVGPFEMPIAPDAFHKSNISGGEPYSIGVPDEGVDAPLRHERHNTTFVGYLRVCFQWGGFPGFERCREVPRDLLAYLTEGLVPI